MRGEFRLYTGSERQKRKQGGFLFYIGFEAGLDKYGLHSEFNKDNYMYSCFLLAIKNACNPAESVMTNLKIMTKGKLFIKS